MATRQYIGARYVPVFADPVEWDNTNTYQPLTMVQHLGETYMTRQFVPIGIDLPDTGQGEESNEYWIHMSNWNAQVEAYRQEVLLYNGRISTLEDDLPIADFDSTNTVSKAIADALALLPGSSFDSVNTVSKAIADALALLPGSSFDSVNTVAKAISDLGAVLPAADFDSVNTVKKEFDKMGYAIRSTDTVAVFSDSTFRDNTIYGGGNAKGVMTLMEEMSGLDLIDLTVSGATTDNLYTQLQTLVNSSSTVIQDADYVIVAYGTNDWQTDKQIIPIAATQTSVMIVQYAACLDMIHTLAPNATIVCVTPAYARNSGYRQYTLNSMAHSVIDYGDIIEACASEHNCACLRLDKMLGINADTYSHMMIPSNTTTWVHYSEETSRRIATYLLNGIYGANASNVEGAFDITPTNWNTPDGKATYYMFGTVDYRQYDSGNPKTLVTPTLVNGLTYYFAFFTDGVQVCLDNTSNVIAECNGVDRIER